MVTRKYSVWQVIDILFDV